MRTNELDILLMLLCILTKRSAINNELLNLMMQDATKGVGPEAQAEKLEWKHYERWQDKEYKWAA